MSCVSVRPSVCPSVILLVLCTTSTIYYYCCCCCYCYCYYYYYYYYYYTMFQKTRQLWQAVVSTSMDLF